MVSPDELEKINERKYYNAVVDLRLSSGYIPVEADLRTSSFYIPEDIDGVVVDSKLTGILANGVVDKIFKKMQGKKCRVLDVCCGMGWLSLELARQGHYVEAYDLSDKSIEYAKKIRDLNIFNNGFGSINYRNTDVTQVNFADAEFDVIIGWSALHHIPEIEKFLDKLKNALKENGLIITYDDFARGKREQFLLLLTRFIIPQIGYSYKSKFENVFQLKNLVKKLYENNDSPMERFASKSSSVEIIDTYFYNNFYVEDYITKNAFCGTPLMRMPDIPLRYVLARLLNAIDNVLIAMKLLKGFDRIIIAKKNKIK